MKRQVAEILRETGLSLEDSDIDVMHGVKKICQAYREIRKV